MLKAVPLSRMPKESDIGAISHSHAESCPSLTHAQGVGHTLPLCKRKERLLRQGEEGGFGGTRSPAQDSKEHPQQLCPKTLPTLPLCKKNTQTSSRYLTNRPCVKRVGGIHADEACNAWRLGGHRGHALRRSGRAPAAGHDPHERSTRASSWRRVRAPGAACVPSRAFARVWYSLGFGIRFIPEKFEKFIFDQLSFRNPLFRLKLES